MTKLRLPPIFLSLALCTTLSCASSPPPAPPIEPVSSDPTVAPPAGSSAEGPTVPPPVAAEPPMATAPPVGVSSSTGPSPSGATAADRYPATDPARPTSGAAPASARATSTTTRGSTRSAATPTAASAGSPPAYTGPDPCKLAVDGDSPVDKACREGGLKSAKTAMKAMLKDARTAGVRFDCDDCHINEEDYAQLSQGTDEKFAKLLAASRK